MSIIRNYLRVQAPDAEVVRILNFIRDDTHGVGSIDFNKIAPIPPWVYQDELTPEAEKRYGAENCWKLWSLQNWGCARNAMDPGQSAAAFGSGGSAVTFRTEDTDVREIARKLSLIFKTAYIDYMWADEDAGKSAGLLGYRDGEERYQLIPAPYSRRAYEMTFDVMGTGPETFGLTFDPIDNTYVYTGTAADRSGSA